MESPSTRPYLIRALHEWCVDHGFTPYLSVAVNAQTRVPTSFVKDAQITLNISGDATQHLSIGNEAISFAARFGGVPMNIHVPIEQVLAIYARENGVGMAFPVAETADPATDVEVDEATRTGAESGKADEATASESVADAKPSRRAKTKLTRIK